MKSRCGSSIQNEKLALREHAVTVSDLPPSTRQADRRSGNRTNLNDDDDDDDCTPVVPHSIDDYTSVLTCAAFV